MAVFARRAIHSVEMKSRIRRGIEISPSLSGFFHDVMEGRTYMARNYTLTEGHIAGTLARFAVPVCLTLCLQALYGGADLLVVGQFASTADVSGVATGSMLLSTVTMIITGLSLGITILVGRHIGRKKPRQAGDIVGGGIVVFALFGIVLTVLLAGGAELFAALLDAPAEALSQTVQYIRICGAGSLCIVAYNVLGAIFRGIGDFITPLITVAVACAINIAGDLLLVAVFDMGAAGAALATVTAQTVSIVLALLMIRNRALPFILTRRSFSSSFRVAGAIVKLGVPVALQELLVGTSFLVIQMLVNSIGIVASAGVGVAEKVCVFLMLVPSAYMQSMAAFTAQNMGAGLMERAQKGLSCGILTAFSAGCFMSYLSFFHGDALSAVFSADEAVIAASYEYLKAYAVDCLLTPFLFCFMGYYNGCGRTVFVMVQGIVGALLVRIPVVYAISCLDGATLFQIGLGTPASSTVQIILCLLMFQYLRKRN